MSRPRVLSRIISALQNSFFSAGRKAKFIGSDQYGNQYFEKIPDHKHNLRGARYIEERPDMRDAFESPKIPVEWESWLRRKRDDPPTEEEIRRNYTRMMQTKLRAQTLEKEFKTIESDSVSDSALPVSENITSNSYRNDFPRYEEFETKPGQKNRDKS